MNPLPRLNPFVKAAYRASCRGLWTSAWVAGILLVHSVGAAAGSDPSIETAIKTYQEAMRSKDRDERMALFAQAERIFSGAIERGARNPSIETNRANAALQAERRGDAIWGYRRALEIDPSYRQARQNLEHARAELPKWVPVPQAESLTDTFFFWRHAVAPDQIKLWAAACFAAACLALAIGLNRPGFSARILAVFFGILWLGLLVPHWIEQQRESRRSGVLIAEETTARSADARHAPPRLATPLPAGTEFFIVQSRANWIEIELSNGLRAWIPASAVAMLNRP